MGRSYDFRFIRLYRRNCARLIGIKIGRLQRSLRGFSFGCLWLFFSTLETIAHPLAHLWLVTQSPTRGQWMCPQTVSTPTVKPSRLRATRSLIQCSYAHRGRNSRPEIYFPCQFSQEWSRRLYPTLVRRKRRKALRHDPQRFGKVQADPKQPSRSDRTLHDTRKTHRP